MNSLLLYWDTETTGLPRSNLPLNHESQPHLVSCSALQITPEGRIQQSMSKMVAPAGWAWDDSPTSEDRAFLVHGLRVEDCRTFGRAEKEVLDEILHLWFAGDKPALLVAHNLAFDRQIIEIAIARYYPGEAALATTWRESPGFCTMQEMRRIKKERGLKCGANLKDTYRHFVGEELERHHSANADAVAVYQIHCAMQAED